VQVTAEKRRQQKVKVQPAAHVYQAEDTSVQNIPHAETTPSNGGYLNLLRPLTAHIGK